MDIKELDERIDLEDMGNNTTKNETNNGKK